MMKIYTFISFQWDGTRYVSEKETWYEYNGPVAQLCGATAAQNNIANSQQGFMSTAQQQAQQVFGNDSQVYGDLMKTFAPTVAAGPSQEGYSAGELSDLNSQAITGTGQAYANAKAATGDAEATQGGGVSQLPSGATVGVDANLAEGAANQTASQLTGIKQADYQQGNANYNQAVAGLAGASNVFGSATNATNAATGAGSAAATSANNVAQENQSWVNSAIGALGSVAGAATGALTGGMMGGGGGGGLSEMFSGDLGAAQASSAQGSNNLETSGYNPTVNIE